MTWDIDWSPRVKSTNKYERRKDKVPAPSFHAPTPAHPMKASPVSVQQFDDEVEALDRACRGQASLTSEEERIDEFDRFYDTVVEVLRNHGTFSDGGLEPADFSSSRYVDLSPVLVVVNDVPVSEPLLAALASELRNLPRLHGVVFDGVEQIAVFSDGRVLVAK